MASTGVFLVGIGGTGGLLAPKLAKTLLGLNELDLWIIDGDIVDEGNVERQPYQEFNINEKKATALSRKLKSCYNLNIFEYSDYLTGNEISKIAFSEAYDRVIILGCVDNHSTRALLEKEHITIKNSFYVDSANGFEDGSVYFSYNDKYGRFKGVLRSDDFPEILKTNDHPSNHCGAEIAKGNTQQFIINDIMANSICMILINFFGTNKKSETETGVVKIEGFERILITC